MFATNRKVSPSPSHTVIDASGATITSTTTLQSRLRSKRFRGDINGLSPEQFEILLRRIGGPSNQTGAPSALGNPGPLGLGAFALSIFMFSVFNAGSYLIDPALLPVVYPAAFFYGGIAQFAAGMWEIRTNNTFGGVVFGSFGMFWIGLAVHFHTIVPMIAGTGKTSIGTGFYLFSWLFFSLIVNAVSWVISFLLFIILSGVSITLLLLVIGCFAPSAVLIKIGGWTGLVTAFIAWYACGAVTFNTVKGRIILPIGLRSNKKKKET